MPDTTHLRKSDLTKRLLEDLIVRRDLPRLTEYISLAREIELRLALSGSGKRCPMDWVIEESFNHASGGDADSVLLLIAAGLDVDACNENGTTILMWAAYWGRIQVVNALIEVGADVNIADQFDGTPILWAMKNNHTDVIELLKAAGARD